MQKKNLKWHFSAHLRSLTSKSRNTQELYLSLMKSLPVHQLDKEQLLPKELTPYTFSKTILSGLKSTKVPLESCSLIHNRIIESLTVHDHAVGAIHARELSKIGGQLTPNSFIQIIRSNPGRVQSSWEIFLNNYKIVKDSKEALRAVLDKLLSFDLADIADGKSSLNLNDISRCFFVINCLKDANGVPEATWQTLLEACVAAKASTLLEYIVQYYVPSSKILRAKLDLTDYQIYQLFHKHPQVLLKADFSSFNRVFKCVGENKLIRLTEDEIEANSKIQWNLEQISKHCHRPIMITSPSELVTDATFEKYIAAVTSLCDLSTETNSLRRITLRCLGIHRGQLSRAERFLAAIKEPDELLKYEIFLATIYNSIKNNDKHQFQDAVKMTSHFSQERLFLSTKRALVVAYSNFDINKSLDIFNKNIHQLRQNPSAENSFTDAALLTESLIVAYLGVKDRDFAHVILEAATAQKIVSGPSIVKQIKSHFSAYGTIIEEPDFVERLKAITLQYILKL
ncbi:LADA_0D10616g1_1 [Lachancea dasiensis]|uniref:LADA_0D10616g1_1 n=1 Tax=Lachancea dasiensis TaxID=1072105 RepID=A0A1G4J851_9SACH|nr:LADA_0D10616g1_1 [Lachancea dasiensis]